MDIIIAGQKFHLDSDHSREFTALSGDTAEFPKVRPAEFQLLFALIAMAPADRLAKLTAETLDLATFLRLRRLGLETFGIKALESCFQTAFLELIQQPDAKSTAKALGFLGRDFTTRKEQKQVDVEIYRCVKKTRPIKLLELNKAK